jgi:hypothetical protein
MQGNYDARQGLFPFTIVITILSSLCFIYLYQGYRLSTESETFLTELGEDLGSMGLYALACIYGRSVLKMLLNKGTLLQRFIPAYQDFSISLTR